MRALYVGLILAGLAGCAPKAPPSEAATARGPVHPDLKCPAGTVGAGAAPPAGFEVWCQEPQGDGSFEREGPSIAWHPNEQRSAEGSWVAGRKEGPWQYFYPTGAPERVGSYVNGVEDGVWTTYRPDGERASEGQMVDGKEHGPWVSWTDGGTRVEGAFVLGAKDGTWTEYDAEDRAVREKIYRDGRLVTQREL